MPDPTEYAAPDLTTSEVADALKVSEDTVQRWAAAGDFPGAYRLPGKAGYRIPQASLDDFRQKREVAS